MQLLMQGRRTDRLPEWLVVLVALAALAGTFILLMIFFSPAAHADVVSNQPTGVTPTTVTLQPYVIALLVGTVTPLLTGLITKLGASNGLKAFTSFVLIAIATVVNQVVSMNGTFNVRDTIILFFTTLVAHAASYLQIWEPLGEGKAPTATWLPNKGFGRAA
jgi:phage-related holin